LSAVSRDDIGTGDTLVVVTAAEVTGLEIG